MTVPDTSTAARKTAVAFENIIRSSTLEHGVLIAADGMELVRKTGGTAHVGFTVAELSRVAEVTFSHNHPGGFGPSLEDVLLGAEYEFRELRVVTTTHRFGVEGLRRSHMTLIQTEFLNAMHQAKQDCLFDVYSCKLHWHDFSREVLHRTWVRLCSMLKFNYWWEQS